jgi:hypothetical protein
MDMVVIFLKYYYSNIWITNVQWLTHLMWKLVFNVIDVIFKFENPKRKIVKVRMNNNPCKAFKKYVFGTIFLKNKQKLQLHMDLWKYGQILTIQRSLIIKCLKFSNKRVLIWVYHLILHHILSPNKKFRMWINISFSILRCYS